MVSQVKRIPMRVRIAAILTVVAGFMLIVRRRFFDESPTTDIEEAPAV